MKFRSAVMILVFALLATGVFAQSADIDIPFQKFVLDNGLTVIVHGLNNLAAVAQTILLTGQG